jgi:hypothetical protein
MEYGVPPGVYFMYGRKDELTNITDKGHICYDYTKCVERIIDTGNFAMFENSRNVNKYLASVKKRNKVYVMYYYDVDKGSSAVLFSRDTQILKKFNKFVTRMLESGKITKHQRDL